MFLNNKLYKDNNFKTSLIYYLSNYKAKRAFLML